ncbi:phage tail tape measure protein [Altibacter sp. HG106]|uniref:phage tail tape measure protein n=1 Tax=Altibacter sp. HG106 TaxID=3023937 RepID=UPI002350F159|nr:phage tail tape measure protein [Altibacter sp. HG106]MDC7994480.1 phage tail tape measure protein [Altibacter sp. HG106]
MTKRIVDEVMRFSIVVNGNSAQKELYDLEKRKRTLIQANKDLRAERSKLDKSLNPEKYKKLSAEIQKNSDELEQNRSKMSALQKAVGVTGLTMGQLRKRAMGLRAQLDNMVPDTVQYKKLQHELQQVNKRMWELRNGARASQGALSKLANGFNKYLALGSAVVATLTGVVFSFQKFIDYAGKLSDAQANVQKTTGLTKKEVDDMTKSFGAFSTRTTRIELLELAEEAGRLGIKGKRDIMAFVEQANKLKVALGDDLSTEQIREVGKLVNVYKVGTETGKDFAGSMDSLGSAINEVAASGANQAGFLVEYLKRQAGIAAQAKISAADNIGYAATFDEIGQSVEVAATAMNKVILDMFQNPGEYAKIAGVSIKEFNKLLEEDSNEAMIKFLEGLNGNNEGLSVMTQKIEELDAGGTRGVQALAALSGATDILRKRQETANDAQKEAISLTNEYNLKNDNLAGLIEKIGRRFRAVFASRALTKGLESFLKLIGRITGAVESNEDAVRQQRLELFKLQSRIFNVNTSNEDRLKLINELKASYPELLGDIDAETVSNEELRKSLKKVNDELVNRIILARKQDEINEQNEDTADKQEEYLKREEKLRETVADIVQRHSDFKFDADKTELQNAKALLSLVQDRTKGERTLFEQGFRDRRALSVAITNLQATESFYNGAVSEGNKLLEEREALKKRLGLIDTGGVVEPDGEPGGDKPKEGDTRFIAGELYTFKNGRWTKVVPEGTKKAQKQDPEINTQLKETLLMRNQLIKDSYLKELADMEITHRLKMDSLRANIEEEQKVLDEMFKTETDPKRLNDQAELVKNLKEQLTLEEEIYQLEIGKMVEEGYNSQLSELQEKYEREKTLRLTEHNNQMAALAGNEKARADLQKQFDKEELDREEKHLKELIREMKQIIEQGDFGGFDLSLLDEEEAEKMKKLLEDLRLKLAEVAKEKGGLSGSGSGSDEEEGLNILEEDVDILGYSAEQWSQVFENLDVTKNKINLAVMAVNAFQNAWAKYHQYVSAGENRRLAEFEKNEARKREVLDNRLDNGLINQRQHDAAVKASEKEVARMKAEIEYKQAKRQKDMAIVETIVNTSVAIMQAYAQLGPIGGTIAAVLIGTLGALNLATIARQPLPAKGFEEGYYDRIPVRREQDGKVFDAEYGGESRSGMVDRPTVFLAGESGRNFPELIVSGPDYKQFSPNLKDSIANELRRVKGFERGYISPNAMSQDATPRQSDEEMKALLAKQNMLLELLYSEGVTATMSRDMRNIKKFRDEFDRLNEIENKAKQ